MERVRHISTSSGRGDRLASWEFPDDQSVGLLQRVFEISTLGIAILDLNGAVMAANPALATMLGYPQDELAGLGIAQLVHPDDWPSEAAELDHVAHGNPPACASEKRLLRKDASAAPARVTTSAVHDREQRIWAMVVMVEDLSPCREAERRRVESERIFASLFESALDAVFVADADKGEIIDANKAAGDLLRCPVETLLGRPQWSLHPDDDDGRHQELFFEYTRNPGTRYSDVWVERPDGSLMLIEVRSGGIITIGRRRLVTTIFRDLSASRETEEALRRSERRYRDMVETTSEGFIHLDAQGVIVDVNEAFCHLLGLSRPDIVGRMPADFVHPAYLDMFQAKLATRAKSRHRAYEMVWQRPDGLERFTRIHASSLFDDAGNLAGSFGLIADLTELKRREAALAKSEARNRAIVETAVDAIITVDIRGKVLSVNQAGERLLGFSAGELVGCDVSAIIPGGDCERHQSYVEDYLAHRMKRIIGIGREVMVKRKDGSTFPAHLSVSEIDLPDFHIFVGMIRDITEFKRAERALIEAKEASDLANRAKTAFLSNMSHELRTPLNGILGFAEIIAQQMLGPLENEEYRNYAAEIKRSGELLLANINDILEMATIEAGQIDLREDLIDFRDVVVSCLRLVAKRAEKARLQIHADIATELPPVEADASALKQVLLHLLSNAIKFTPEGGRIGVAARVDANGELVVEVFDTGIGIPADRLEGVFQPFAQGDATLSRRYEGIGLGLSISKKLVEMHGGRLEIHSTEDVGTSVVIRLPKSRMVGDW